MGIRFTCPNGHRLHVKSFLAGKRGICPHCASRFDIPLGDTGRVEAVSLEAPQHSSSRRIVSTLATVEESNQSGVNVGAGAASGSTATIAPPPEDIVADKAAAWYVRPAAGGQYGPADESMMREWIREDRVPADALVWREDWPEWRRADEVFTELAETPAAAEDVFVDIPDLSAVRGKGLVAETPSSESSGSASSVSRGRTRRRRGWSPGRKPSLERKPWTKRRGDVPPSGRSSKRLVVLLSLTIAVLAALLVFVVVYFGQR